MATEYKVDAHVIHLEHRDLDQLLDWLVEDTLQADSFRTHAEMADETEQLDKRIAAVREEITRRVQGGES